MNLSQLLPIAADRLSAANVPDARREASLLLEYAIGRGRAFVIAHPEYVPEQKEAAAFADMVAKRCDHVPFHYIVGSKEFYGLDFKVTPDVLIPRPETEMLVSAAIEELSCREAPRFCEIGVGSGCISISILHNVPAAKAIGSEISPAAIAIALENSLQLNVADRFDIRLSDLYTAIDAERFDLIVTNPPYVPLEDISTLQPEVKDHEPWRALTDGGDGLSLIRMIIDRAPAHLLSGGLLLIEIGFGQAEAVLEMFDADVWEDARIEPDVRSIPRMAAARLIK